MTGEADNESKIDDDSGRARGSRGDAAQTAGRGDPAWVTTTAAAAGVLVALVTAITGLRSLRQLRTDSRERSRPLVAAELRKPPYTRGTQLLVIRNYRPSIARDVEVTFDPPIADPTPERAAPSVSPFITRRYAKPIHVVTPGMELTNIWFSGRMDGNEWVNFEPTPDRFTVIITYGGPDGTRYKDQFPLDTDLIRKHTYVSSSTDPENQIQEITKSLAQIEKSIVSIASTAGSWETDQSPAELSIPLMSSAPPSPGKRASADAEHPA